MRASSLRRRASRCLGGAGALALAVTCAVDAPPGGQAGAASGAGPAQKLTAPGAAANDIFGAALALAGDLAVVACEYDDDRGVDSGSAWVFRRREGSFAVEQKLLAADGAAGDNFGRAVATDGERIVVGAHWDDTARGANAGSAYVFAREGGRWVQEQKLVAPDGAREARFGVTVDVDGDRVAVGAWRADGGPGAADAGAAYVFRLADGRWQLEQRLAPRDADAGDEFGRSVALDGDTLLVGAWHDDEGGKDAGAAYVFRRGHGGWVESAKLRPAAGAAGDELGYSVSLDRGHALVGAHRAAVGGVRSGAAWVFRQQNASWVEEQQLLPPTRSEDDWFGWATALDGDLALVGAHRTRVGRDRPGVAVVYARGAGAGGRWVERGTLRADDAADEDTFGFFVALSGSAALVGAWRDDDAGPDSGSAYAFESLPPGD